MGLLHATDWKAQWISCMPLHKDEQSVLRFSRNFSLGAREIASARAYATAKGIYDLWINGIRVSADRFRPGWVDYNRRLTYQTYDVAGLLREGNNVVQGVVAPGWYCGHVCWFGSRQYGMQPQFLLQLEVSDKEGTQTTVVTDSSWTARGHQAAGDLIHGESMEAVPGDGKPSLVETCPLGQVPLEGQAWESVVECAVLSPRHAIDLGGGKLILDFGQNLAGVVRWQPRDGSKKKVKIRHGEMLAPDGQLYTQNLRTARAEDTLVADGEKHGPIEPRFTFHGFRYAEVTSESDEINPEEFSAVVLSQNLRQTSAFACSDERLNKLFDNIRWSMKSNFLETPTDCPQRDERLGWLGDAQVFCRTATFLADVSAFFTKYLRDVRDGQSVEGAFPNVAPNMVVLNDGAPGWADAGVIIPWVLYRVYGDKRILKESLPSMKKYVEFVAKWNADGIWRHRRSHDFGDWLHVDDETSKALLATAFFAQSAHITALATEVVEGNSEASRYRSLSERIQKAFVTEFTLEGGRLIDESQTGYVLALAFDLFPSAWRKSAANQLAHLIHSKGHLTTGFLGSGLLLPVLTRFGHSELAYSLLMNDTYPGWLFPVKHGATTMWERWDGWMPEKEFQDPGMNSFNHYAFGAVGEWMMTTLLGIDLHPDVPGYEHILIAPIPGGGIQWAEGTYHSIRGPISLRWECKNSALLCQIDIPIGSHATVCLPGMEQTQVGPGVHHWRVDQRQ